ncbi:MAG: flap endonuclease-1 [Candidatus Hadarchaeota archaeon]
MGVKIKDIVPIKEITLEHLKGKSIATDAMNTLYQFLSIIRQPDGTPLKDSEGRITSHLSGLFYRTSNLVEIGIEPAFVFDGKPPELKSETLENRRRIRAEAEEKRKKALKKGEKKKARKHAERAARLSKKMVEQAKELLDGMGIPWIQAPSEGEAQAAYMTKKGDTWGTGSQDFDALLYGSPKLIRNMTITGKRKLPGKDKYKEIKPEIIELEKILDKHGIERKQLIAIGILVGTDFNDGIKGIGPKKSLKLVKKIGGIDKIVESGEIESLSVDPLEVENLFMTPEVTDDYNIEWMDPKPEKIKEFLCEKHDFSESRIDTGIEKLKKGSEKRAQVSLEKWA